MDFTLEERQQAVADLAAEVLTAEDPWKELAQAGLLDVSPPDGLGVLEVAVLLTEIGKRTPSMKALATLMTGALPLPAGAARPCSPASPRASSSSPPPSASPPPRPPPPQQSPTAQSPASRSASPTPPNPTSS